MTYFVNFLLSITLFILVALYIEREVERQKAITLEDTASRKNVRKVITISIAILEVSWIYWVLSLILWLGLDLQNGLLPVVLMGIAGLIVLPVDLMNRHGRTFFNSWRDEYIKTIEYLYHNESDEKLLDIIIGLCEEAIMDTDAHAALELLSNREDSLGDHVRKITSEYRKENN